MIEFIDDNGKLRRVTEYTMDEWNGTEWVTIEDYTPESYWDGFTDEEFLAYLDTLPAPNPMSVDYCDVIGEPWPTSIERRSYFYDGGSY